MPNIVHSLIYLASCVTSTVCLAACSNSLHRRNINVGEQSRASAAKGIKLILSTNDLTGAGFALSVGAGGIAVGTLILLVYSLHVFPVTSFQRKIFFLSPLMLFINTLLLIAGGIAVVVLARTGTTTAVAYLGTQRLPDSIVRAQAKAAGVPLDYWSNGYVKFMAASPWPALIFAIPATWLAYKAYQVEKPSAQRHREELDHDALQRRSSGFTEKAEDRQIERGV
ncbi:hypothetical protein I317_06078 [Kwoniella heveanensis CBS 569]|nr:hypothetical protein I317_06078 [Kwoniella heveanensis CBS 569]